MRNDTLNPLLTPGEPYDGHRPAARNSLGTQALTESKRWGLSRTQHLLVDERKGGYAAPVLTIICEFPGCLLPREHEGYDHASDLARLINHRFDRLENHVTDLAAEQAVESQAITDLGARIGEITGSIQAQIDAAVQAQKDNDQAAFDAATAEATRQVDVLNSLAPAPAAPRVQQSTENDQATPVVDGVGVPLSDPAGAANVAVSEPQPDEAPPADVPADEGTDSVPDPAPNTIDLDAENQGAAQ